ncbi:LysR family transcriptional regulator [Nocardioides sp. AX2bis]|uniref:LysR family transcriptional regulator n=1 Tax=Nocardioides sp. AX2bis TaxID=2653157 RepID=UPI0012F1724E|nr:LysR substrate-binding domain-containing protein [Nocardioides sp. AX2bis]VXC10172.1 LysR family transcriptional regulator [Nocardioides sp. AX2bis]
MDLRQLRYFAAVVREGSVSRAAATLDMTQPPLSAAIAQLERELGVRLLERHSRGVDATVAGELLAREAVRLLDDVDEVTAAVRGIGSGRTGRLAVATASAVTWEILPNLLVAFERRSRDVDSEVVEAGDPEVVDRVRDRRADVGVVYCTRTQHLERLRGRELEVALIHREPVVVVVPGDSPLAAEPTVDLASLGDERWIVPTAHDGFPGLAAHTRQAWQLAGISPDARRTVDSASTVVRLVAAGLGIALVPASVRALGPGLGTGLRTVRLATPLAPVEAAVVWRRNERPSPVLGRFLRAALATEEPDRLGPSVARHHVPGED